MDTAGQILLGTSASPAGTESMANTAAPAASMQEGNSGGSKAVDAGSEKAENSFSSQMNKAVSQAETSESVANTTTVNPADAAASVNRPIIQLSRSALPLGNKLQQNGEILPGSGIISEQAVVGEAGSDLMTLEAIPSVEEGDENFIPEEAGSEHATDSSDESVVLGADALSGGQTISGNFSDAQGKNNSGVVPAINGQGLPKNSEATLANSTTNSQGLDSVPASTPVISQPTAASSSLSAETSEGPVVMASQVQSTKATTVGQSNDSIIGDTKNPAAISISSLHELTGSVNAKTAQADSAQTVPTGHFPKVEGGGSYQQVAAVNLQTSVTAQVASPGWGETVMQRVMWMSSQQVRSAEIQLDPPELGSLMVKINTVNEQTTVNFTSSHAVVRDALDQSLPKLRDLMDEQGLDLVDVDVSEHSGKGEASDGEAEPSDEGSASSQLAGSGTDDDAEGEMSVSSVAVQSSGLINAYA